MDAVHDSVICVACGRFGSNDVRMRVDFRDFYLTAADLWLKRPEKSFGREARSVANIIHAGAKLKNSKCSFETKWRVWNFDHDSVL
jgi:hypothetical protein